MAGRLSVTSRDRQAVEHHILAFAALNESRCSRRGHLCWPSRATAYVTHGLVFFKCQSLILFCGLFIKDIPFPQLGADLSPSDIL